jgi:glycerophosphoryl diester phosphodiesterase
MPNRYAFLDAPLPIAFAHRGSDSAAENSMGAFAAVLGLGYRYLETDVRATRDGVLLAFHDATLDRVTDRPGRIADLPYREVARARIAGTEPIPLLAEVLEAWPDARLNLDVKAGEAVRPLIDLVRRTNVLDRICVGSFSDARLAAVRAGLGPKLCTSLGPREVVRLRLGLYRGAAGCAQTPARLGGVPITDSRMVAYAHRRGLQVHVWTVNEEAEMNRLLDLGVDGIMTDRADLLRDVLTARNAWHG